MRHSEKRYKLFTVSISEILRVMSGNRRYRLSPGELPEGYEVVSVRSEDFISPPCLIMMIYHPSFDIVPDYEIPPRTIGRFELIGDDARTTEPTLWLDRQGLL